MARLLAALVSAIAIFSSPAHATDQLILGKSFVVKDPMPGIDPSKRSVVALGKELSSPNTLVGNPLTNGASVEIVANGGTPTDQVVNLLPGAYNGSNGWKALGSPVIGYSYKDVTPTGPVKTALIKKAANGIFILKVVMKGTNGATTVIPPNPGTDGGMRFTIAGGDSYCVNFGGAAGGKTTNAPKTVPQNKTFKIASTS